jgi:hypothetical protein
LSRIALNPPEARKAAKALEQAAEQFRELSLSLRGDFVPPMPAYMLARVVTTVAAASKELDGTATRLDGEAEILEKRAWWAEYADRLRGWGDMSDPLFTLAEAALEAAAANYLQKALKFGGWLHTTRMVELRLLRLGVLPTGQVIQIQRYLRYVEYERQWVWLNARAAALELNRASAAARALRAVGRVGTITTVVIPPAAQLMQDWNDPRFSTGEKAARAGIAAATEGGGALAGGWAGLQVGGAAGGAIGTAIFPGPGTAVGAGVGSVVGAIGGAFAGSKAGGWVKDKIFDHIF